MAKSCELSVPKVVTASISADTLSAVSGTDLPLRVSIANDGDEALPDGSLVITVTREPRAGDFSQGNEFVVARSIVKTNIDLAPRSTAKSSFAWKIPASLPSGIYRADAAFLQGGKMFENAAASTSNPFGNSTKMAVRGEVAGGAFFIAGNNGNDEPSIVLLNNTQEGFSLPVTINAYSGDFAGGFIGSKLETVTVASGSSTVIAYPVSGFSGPYSISAETAYRGVPSFYLFSSGAVESECPVENPLYSWAMLIGGIGAVLFLLIRLKAKRNQP